MNSQPQTRSPPSRTVPIHCTDNWKRRKVLEQTPVYRSLAGRGWIKYCIFFQRPQLQPPRATIPNSSPSIRPGAQTPTAVYQANQHIMMVNHLPMPYPVPQGPQYCIPQYRHGGPPYVGPPQQYPVQPPGPGPFYPGPGPGDFANAYGTPFYPSQPVYQSAPIIVPTQQQPPPAKREKKTIRIRDPNQGGKDITEEIMSGGGSRNPTPPIGRPTSTPTPPQLPSQVPEHSPVVYGTVESAHLAASTPVTAASDQKQEEKPKPDPVFQSSSTVLRLVLSGEKKERAGQVPETPAGEPTPEPPRTSSPTTLPPLTRSSIPSPTSAALSSQPLFTTVLEDKCDLSSSKEDALPVPSPTSCTAVSDPSLTDDNDICKKPCSVALHDIQLISSTNLINEMNGVGEKLPAKESIVDMVKQEALPLTLELEILQHPQEEMKAECTPTPVTPSTLPSFSPAPLTPPTSPPCTPVISATIARSVAATVVPRVAEEGESIRTCLSEDANETQNKTEAEADGQTEEIVDSQTLNSRRSPAPETSNECRNS
ncbi:eukaryotic translation initiation factor 4 gamma 3 isoform X31 [Peromyscus maniculatus bairdii]|uniref:eukaryotic translation initiation factor 4 gamma 3 isoform X31 n=1 Tax=Peromyscus maniculatus bairdii TaxID=230844 RepID=UPI003FD0F86F